MSLPSYLLNDVLNNGPSSTSQIEKKVSASLPRKDACPKQIILIIVADNLRGLPFKIRDLSDREKKLF